jgi:thiol-disulfide isomerase/thioredoxin
MPNGRRPKAGIDFVADLSSGLTRAYFALMLLATLASACAAQGSSPTAGEALQGVEWQAATATSTLQFDKLPHGIGRGYPVASMEEGEGSGKPPAVGEPAPNFRLTLPDGRSLTTADLRGRPLIINHWATWCGPCREEMPVLIQAARDHPEIALLAVNMQEARSQIEPFAAEFGMDLPIVLDGEGVLTDLNGVRGLPTTLFVDREGRLTATWAGALSTEKLTELIAPLLQSSP